MTGDPPARIVVVERRGPGNGLGLAAIILGLLGIFVGVVFAPFGLLFSVLAMVRGQIALGLVGLLCNTVALLTSIWFWALFGVAAGFTILSF